MKKSTQDSKWKCHEYSWNHKEHAATCFVHENWCHDRCHNLNGSNDNGGNIWVQIWASVLEDIDSVEDYGILKLEVEGKRKIEWVKTGNPSETGESTTITLALVKPHWEKHYATTLVPKGQNRNLQPSKSSSSMSLSRFHSTVERT